MALRTTALAGPTEHARIRAGFRITPTRVPGQRWAAWFARISGGFGARCVASSGARGSSSSRLADIGAPSAATGACGMAAAMTMAMTMAVAIAMPMAARAEVQAPAKVQAPAQAQEPAQGQGQGQALGQGQTQAQGQAQASSQEWPLRPIKMLIPFPPGGVSDVMGRFWAQKLSAGLGTPVVVENRPGAGTTIAAGVVAKSPPDGYTLYFADVTTHAINATLYRSLPYKSDEDFTDIALVSAAPLVFVVPPQVPAQDLQQFIALAKSRPGYLNYASSGNGTILHLAGETLKQKAGIEMVHVPYKGSPEAVMATLSGQSSATFSALPPALPQIAGGKLRALGVTSTTPNAALPGVPPIAGTLPGFDMVLYSGILGPAGMPPEVVQRINAEVSKVLKEPETRKFYASVGADPVDLSPAAFTARMRELIAAMSTAVRQSGAVVN
jgi:tripartite-type tricarboxylate transporter receptor subunit TctC